LEHHLLLAIGKSDWIQFSISLKEGIVNDVLSQNEIIDAISKQYINIEMKHIQEYVKRKIYIIKFIKQNKASLTKVT